MLELAPKTNAALAGMIVVAVLCGGCASSGSAANSAGSSSAGTSGSNSGGSSGPPAVSSNRAPVARVPSVLAGAVGQVVTLDGRASTDPDGDALTYSWRLVSSPSGSMVALSASANPTTTLTPDQVGVYIVSLTVRDGSLDSIAATTRITAHSSPMAAPPGQIKIRSPNSVPEFFDASSGKQFVSRGFNFVRLASVGHATFNVGRYDGERASAAFAAMAGMGFNTVRVFLSVSGDGSLSAPAGGLADEYISNLVDFLRRADAAGVRVIITSDGWLAAGYGAQLRPEDANFQISNSIYLSKSGVEETSRFWRDFSARLVALGAPMRAILALSIANEAFADGSSPPFTRHDGTVLAGNDHTYDMADNTARASLVSDGIRYFADSVATAIHGVAANTLVTMGFFPPNFPNVFLPGDTRLVPPAISMLEASQIDFLDIHLYPPFGISMAKQLENFGYSSSGQNKLLLMGEFGQLKTSKPTAADAAQSLVDWQVQSCSYRVAGWLMWTWDTTEQESGRWWAATEQNNTIASALSPAHREDPCAQ